ncbi:MAG: DUF2237 domain-containing protein [Myxococcota bacterium]|nr:DUF2237 domain-containing protein [Myxococcota bacterium]
MKAPINLLGTPLLACSLDPKTGWYRDGCCNTDEEDMGSHTVCARVTDAFLEFIQMQGNDLITPNPGFGFPGLRAGDQWCVCAASWRQAYLAGVACPVILESTHAIALESVKLEELMEHALAVEV